MNASGERRYKRWRGVSLSLGILLWKVVGAGGVGVGVEDVGGA